jgi:hypothetical protein
VHKSLPRYSYSSNRRSIYFFNIKVGFKSLPLYFFLSTGEKHYFDKELKIVVKKRDLNLRMKALPLHFYGIYECDLFTDRYPMRASDGLPRRTLEGLLLVLV